MIFVGLANGCVQAFDAVTLESLWLYEDPLGGQPNCPITYEAAISTPASGTARTATQIRLPDRDG